MTFAGRVSAYNRGRKWRRFLAEFAPSEHSRVLDVGFSDREYSSVDNYIEKHYPWPHGLTAAGIDSPVEFPRRYPDVKALRYDGVRLPFADGEFDIVWSNAVLEHVGGRDEQVAFVRELLRVGDALYLTTPNRFFPVEVHTRLPFVHWLPKTVFDRIAKSAGMGWAAGSYMHLMGRSGLRSILDAAGAPDARIVANRLGPWAVDFVAIVPRAAR